MSQTALDRINGVNNGVAIKAPVRVTSASNITLSGLQTIDGVALAENDRVLVRGQSTASQNGIYNASSGIWARAIDFNGNRDVVAGTIVQVTEGSLFGGTRWRISTTGSITIGTTAISFVRDDLIDTVIPDGNKGDITVSGGGASWQINAGVIGNAELANLAVTGAKLNDSFVNDLTTVTAAAGDFLPIADVSDSNRKKKVLISDIVSLAAPPLYSHIAGFLPSSIAGTNTTATLTVSAGQATDSTNTALITRAITTSWAVANGNAINGFQGGATLPNSSTIHFFVCSGGSGSGVFASTSLAPTLPTGYNTAFRRIFSLRTSATGALLPIAANELHGGGLISFLGTQILDINGASPGTGSRTLYPLTVPAGVKVQPLYRMNPNTFTPGSIIITSPDETDVVPAGYTIGNYYTFFSAVPGYDGAGNSTGGYVTNDAILLTDTSAQIGIRAAGTVPVVYWVTRGWIDFRR